MSKRGQGEGSVFRRADGRWVAQVSLGRDAEGKRQRWTAYADSQREARRLRDETLGSLRKGKNIGSARQLLRDFLETWLASRQHALAPNTYRSYERKLRLFLIPALGHLTLAELAPQHVQSLLDTLHTKGYAARTIQYTRAVLRAALGQALAWDTVERNAATLAHPPKIAPTQQSVLTAEQAALLLTTTTPDPLHALYVVALTLGLRQGEILGLRWRDLDFDQPHLRVARNLQRDLQGRLTLQEPKSARSERVLPLPQITLTALRQRKQRQAEERLRAGPSWSNGLDLVFTSRNGAPLNRHNLYRQWRRHLKAAKLPSIRFYDLRHTCASFLFAQHVEAKTISDILGHSTTRLTLDTYTHVMPAALQGAAATMDHLFRDQKTAT